MKTKIYGLHHIILLLSLMLVCGSARAQLSVGGVDMERDGSKMVVDMALTGLSTLKVPSKRAVVYTPVLVGADGQRGQLPAIGIYGRDRYYHYLRQSGPDLLTGAQGVNLRASSVPDTLLYSRSVAYEPWMDGATLVLEPVNYGCCGNRQSEEPLVAHVPQTPLEIATEMAFVTPLAEAVKTRSLQGSAFIDFPVNKTTIYPDYRSNPRELAKIRATIDSVRSDQDVTVTAINLCGYASPEGSWQNNVRLARGRTEALRKYIEALYDFPSDLYHTASVPEDWAGLVRYLEQSNLPHRAQLLDIAQDSLMEPDRRDALLRSRYPDDYAVLLADCYPALRHCDYEVAYTVRTYTNAEEIEQVMRTRPGNLSLGEFYMVAAKYPVGSPRYCEIMETAVAVYPDDKVANLNAANAALLQGNLELAEKRLKRAGSGAEAEYARGMLAHRRGDNQAAIDHFVKALPLQQAKEALNQLKIQN